MKKYIILGAFLASSITSASALSDISHSDFREYIINAQSENIISGYSDNTFRPNNSVSFIESLKMAINTGPQRKNIDTIPGQSWFKSFVDYYNNNQKVDFLHFSNNEYITRDFAIYLVLKQLGIDVDSTDIPHIPTMFSDIDNGTPLASYILFAKYAGIVSGYSDGAFGPKNRVSRGEFTKMLWKSLREDKSQIMQKYSAIKNKTIHNIPKTVHIGIKELGVSFDIPAKRQSHVSYEKSTQKGKIATISYGDFFGAVSQYSPQPRGGYEADNARKMVRGSSDFEYTVQNYCSFTNTTLGLHDCERLTTQNNIFYIRGILKQAEMGGTQILQQMQYFIENKNSEFPVITLWTKKYPTSDTAGLMKEAGEIERIIESMQNFSKRNILNNNFTYEDIKKQGTIYCGKNRITLKNEPIIQVFSSNNTLITEVNNGFSAYNIACNNGEISFSVNYGEALVGVMDYIHIDANGALQRQECTSEYSEVTGKIIQTTYRLNGKVTEIKNGNTTIGECVRIGDIISQQNPQSYTPVHLDTTNWNTYNNPKYNFSFQYPSNATLNMYEGDISPQGKKVNIAEMLMLNFPKGAVNIRLPGFETFHGWAPSMDGSGPLDVIVDGKKISKSYEFRGQSEPRVGKKEEWELQYYVSPDQLPKSFVNPKNGGMYITYSTPEFRYRNGFEKSFRNQEVEATIESIIADIIR